MIFSLRSNTIYRVLKRGMVSSNTYCNKLAVCCIENTARDGSRKNQSGGHCDNPGEMMVVGQGSQGRRRKKWLNAGYILKEDQQFLIVD